MGIWKQECYGTGRCVNCGYLGKRDEDLRISECYGVSEYDRKFGTLNEYIDPRPKTTLEVVPKIKTFPWCFVSKANLRNEAEELFDAGDAELRNENVCIQRIITVERDCPSWYPWREFSSPREQWEESMMLAMEKRREEFELKLEEINRQERKRTNGIMIGLTIAAIIFAAMQVYAVLASINPEHWLFNWLR